jgi:hypothetical protein
MVDEYGVMEEDKICSCCGNIIKRGKGVNIFQFQENSQIDYYCMTCFDEIIRDDIYNLILK